MKKLMAIFRFRSGKIQKYEVCNSAPHGLREGAYRPNYMYLEIPSGYRLTNEDREWIAYYKKAILAGREGVGHTVSNEIDKIINS